MSAEGTAIIKAQTALLFKQYHEAVIESEKIALENDIIFINSNFALHKASQYRYTHVDEEDIIASAMVGLMMAVRTYDESKAQFSTYANRVIENEICDCLRKASRKKYTELNPVSLDQDVGDSSITRMDTVTGETNIEEEYMKQSQFQRILEIGERVLNEMEWVVFRNSLNTKDERLTQADLGKMFSSSQTTISRIEKRAIKKLRIFLQQEEWGLDILR